MFDTFQGAAKRLEDLDIPRIGSRINVGEDEIHAFMEVEANGSGFDAQGRPKALFEPHVFYRNLSGEERQRAVDEGLAYARWRRGNYPTDSFPRIKAAMRINQAAALKATSWGATQILGENYRMVGYATVEDMVSAFMDDEENHLEAMVNFLIASGIDDDLREHRWEIVARVYNGPKYAEHNYHGRMAAAFAKWQRIADTPYPGTTPSAPAPRYPAVQIGANGFVVKHLQETLDALGYRVGMIDGKFGPSVRAAVLAFQADNNLTMDGTVGDETWSALENAPRPLPISEERATATVSDLRDEGSRTVQTADIAQVGGAVVAVGGALGTVEEVLGTGEQATGLLGRATALIEPLTGFLQANWQVALLAVGALVIWSAWKQKRIRLDDHRTGANKRL
jgi:hypothetical protein